MSFTTLTFLLFLTLVFSAYWSLRSRIAQNVLLLVSSYVFYGWWDYRFCVLMLLTSLQDFAVGWWISRVQNPRGRRILLGVNVACNLGVLGYFKYSNFFLENLVVVLSKIGVQAHAPVLRVLLPAGISFYTFQAMSYTIDIYRRRIEPAKGLLEYLAFISFFPHLVAGPIMKAAHLLPQFVVARRFSYSAGVAGLRQMLWGFFKKMVLADNLGPIVDSVYSRPAQADAVSLSVATVAFAFQIYCDFSAYSDIAIGTAKLFGFDLMRNFAYPYFSRTPAEFWRRWHISLSSWFRDYFYIPLGGSRVGPLRQAANVLATFMISGLWHGASWNFLIWGGLNGLAVLPETWLRRGTPRGPDDVPGSDGLLPSPGALLSMAGTFLFTCVAWVFFRAATLRDAVLILTTIVSGLPRALLSRAGRHGLDPLSTTLHLTPLPAVRLLAALACFVVLEWGASRPGHPIRFGALAMPYRWLVYTGFVWAILYHGTYSSGQFIYFRF